jgi:hypothetical protein
MELLIMTAALFALGTLARFFGYDSRDEHDRAIDAAHRGDRAAFRQHINALERDVSRRAGFVGR